MIAGLTPDQQSAFGTINSAQGMSQPYINQAAQWSQQSAAPISGGDISQYLNPYQQDVTNATMANINETNAQQQQQVVGSAIGKGAWGGDRAGVAQSELARQQGLASNATLAGLNQQNYSTALQTAQADKNRAGQNAYTYGSLGQQALGNSLTGAQAQLTSGGLQQQQQQAELSNAYQQYQLAQAFPYQQTQWLAGIDSGIGSNAGGTSTGQTTAPAPNQTAQYAGLGLAGAGLLGQSGAFGAAGWMAPLMLSDERVKEDITPVGKTNDGQTIYRYRFAGDPTFQMGLLAQDVEKTHPESVGSDAQGLKHVDYKSATDGAAGFALGGAPNGEMFGGPQGFIPQMNIAHGSGPPRPQGAAQQQQAPSSQNAIGMVSDAMKLGTQLKGTFGGQPTSLSPDGGAYSPAGIGSVQMPSDITGGLGSAIYSHGGGVRGYDDGGGISDDLLFDPGAVGAQGPFNPTGSAVSDSQFVPQDTTNVLSQDMPMPRPRPEPQPSLAAAQIAPPVTQQPAPQSSADSASEPTGGLVPNESADAMAQATPAGQRAKPDPWQSLTAAGFAMLANKSPFLGNAIGEAGLAGLGNYAAQKKELNTEGHQQATEDISRQGMKLRAQQLKDNLAYHQKQLGISQQNANSLEKSRTDTAAERERAHKQTEDIRQDALRTKTLVTKDENGVDIINQYNPATGRYDPTGQNAVPKGGAAGAKPSAQMQLIDRVKAEAKAKGEDIDSVEALRRAKGLQDKQTKFQQAKDTQDVKRMETYASAGEEANMGLAHLDNVDRLRKQAWTGPVQGPVAGMLGHPATQALEGAVNTMGLDIGKQMKGSLSDKDILFIKAQLPGLATGTKAGEAISGMIRAGYERVKQRGLFYRQWGEKFKTLDGADAAWNGYINSDGRMTVDDPKAVGGAKFNPNYNRNFSDYIAQPGEVKQFKQGQGVFDGRTWHPVNAGEATP